MEIIADAEAAAHGEDGPFLYAPWASGLPSARIDILSLLPILGVNDGFEVPASARRPSGPSRLRNAVACLMAADPFIHIPSIARRMRGAQIGAVANFPTVQLMDGETGQALDAAGCGAEREFDFLERMAALGFSTTAFVTGRGALRRAASLKCTRLVIHPGLPLKDWRSRAAMALKAAEIVRAARQDVPGAEILVFRPAGFGNELDATLAQADGTVSWSPC